MDVNIFLFWWSIISSIFALGFLGWDIWQFASSRKDKDIQLKEKELHKAQVKIWQHFANGINHNLLQINNAIQSGKLEKLKSKELEPVIGGIQANAHALYTSLNEERLFSEEEIKQRQLDQELQLKEMFENPKASTSPSKTIRKVNQI